MLLISGRVVGHTPSVADVQCPVLVGRDAELRVLTDAVAAARGGHGGVVFLAGEAGIGKSRLVREMTGRARDLGAEVVTGRGVPAAAGGPYRPLAEALLQALRRRPRPDDPGLAPWQPVLAAIVPTLGRQDASREDASREDADREDTGRGEASAAVRGEAVIQLVERLADPGGIVMVLEDLHWADPDTLAVVEYLGDNLADQPVLCVATIRTEPGGEALEVARRLHARHAARLVPLARLSGDQVAEMVSACVPDAGDDVVDRVRRTAEGVPLLVEEVLASPGLPGSFADSVRSRWAGLADDDRLVLEAAAVLGRDFEWQLLAPATGRPAGRVAAALDCGVAAMLLSVDGDRFRFRHALTREAVLEGISPPRRVGLAAAALAALEAGHPRLAGRRLEAAADLAVMSGDQRRAGELLVASGRTCVRQGALRTAVATLARAAELAEGPAARDEAERLLVEALGLAGRMDEALTVGEGLIARLAGQEATAATCAEVHARLAQAAIAATRWPTAAAHIAAAADWLRQAPRPDLAAQLTVLDAEVALAADDTERAQALARQAISSSDADPEVRCHGWEVVGRVERMRDPDAAQRAFEHALGLATSAGLALWRLRALHELGTIEMLDHGGTGRLEQALREAVNLGAVSTTAVLELQLAAASECRFAFDEAEDHLRAALAVSERLGLAQVRAKVLYFLAENRALRGDREGMEHFLALTAAAAPGDRQLEAFAWGGARGMLALLADDRVAALAAFRRAATLLRTTPHAEPAFFRGLWPVLLAAVGEHQAQAAIDEARRAGIAAVPANHGMLGYAEAILAGCRGEPGRAGDLAQAADQALACFPGWVDLARLLAAESALKFQWGQPDRWLRAAYDSFTVLGYQALAERCRELLGGPRPTRWTRYGFTARETEVLALVSQGLANKQIASRLRCSARTVEKHVESLLRKAQARSRTELVALVGAQAEPSE
jgi:DNA-binding CsgD family transcriptional regulator/tetratricopeptide (TPR) repeat protein